MYDSLRYYAPPKVYHAGGRLDFHTTKENDSTAQNEEEGEDTGLLTEQPSSSSNNKGPYGQFKSLLKDAKTNLWLWRRRTWAHYRGFGIELVDEEGNLLYDEIETIDEKGNVTYEKGTPLISYGFSPEITVERLNRIIERRNGAPVFIVERPHENAFVNVNSFEFASDQIAVGGHNGLVLTIALFSYFFSPMSNLLFVFGAMAGEALLRIHFNWIERNNANNINPNKNFKTFFNTFVFTVTSLVFCLLATAAFLKLFSVSVGFLSTATPFLLLIPVAVTGYRVLQHGTGALENLKRMLKTWSDPLEWRRYRKQFIKKTLQTSEAFAVFVTTAVIIGAIEWFAPLTSPKIALSFFVGTIAIKAFSSLREYPPFNALFDRFFPGEEQQRKALREESLADKIVRFLGNPVDNSQTVQRKKIHHLGVFNEELNAIHATISGGVNARDAQATALFLMLESEQGISRKIADYCRKENNNTESLKDNFKYLFLTQIRKILLEDTSLATSSISEQLEQQKAALNTLINERIQLQIKLVQDPGNQHHKDLLKEKEELIKKAQKNLGDIEAKLVADPYQRGNVEEKIGLCRTTQDFETFFKVNPEIKREIFHATRKIGHCEAFYQAWVRMNQLFPDKLTPQLVGSNPPIANPSVYLDTLKEHGKKSGLHEENCFFGKPSTSSSLLQSNQTPSTDLSTEERSFRDDNSDIDADNDLLITGTPTNSASPAKLSPDSDAIASNLGSSMMTLTTNESRSSSSLHRAPSPAAPSTIKRSQSYPSIVTSSSYFQGNSSLTPRQLPVKKAKSFSDNSQSCPSLRG